MSSISPWGRSLDRWIFPSSAILFLGALIVAPRLHWSLGTWAAVGNAAFAVTGLLVIWYAWETRRLADQTKSLAAEATLQTALQVRPYLIVEPAGVGAFQVKNVGRGPGFNVRIADVVVSTDEEVLIHFPASIPVVVPGETASLQPTSSHRGRSAGDFYVSHIGPYATLPLEVTLECQDLAADGHRFTQRVRLTQSQADRGVLEIVGYEFLGAIKTRE